MGQTPKQMYVGFDVGGTFGRASLFDPSDWSEVVGQKKRIRSLDTPDQVAEAMAKLLDQLIESRPNLSLVNIESAGFAIAAQLNKSRKVILNAPNLGWRDVDFESSLQTYFPDSIDFELINDLNAQLIGELTAEELNELDSPLAVYVGTGVGASAMVDGELLRGAGGVAGELGHMKVAPGGRLCGCGERGCLEAYVGGLALEKRVAQLLESKNRNIDRSRQNLELDQFDQNIDDDEQLDKLWEEATDYLAVMIANTCTFLNPDGLLLGGGILENLENFRTRLISKIPPLVSETARRGLHIKRPVVGEKAGVLGAARFSGFRDFAKSDKFSKN